jgi:hypothetical protein
MKPSGGEYAQNGSTSLFFFPPPLPEIATTGAALFNLSARVFRSEVVHVDITQHIA